MPSPSTHSPCRSRISLFSVQHHTNPAGNRCTACMPYNIVWMPVRSPHTFRIISPPISVLHLPFSFSHPSIHSFRRRRRWYPTTSEQHQQPPSRNAIALPIPVQSYVLRVYVSCVDVVVFCLRNSKVTRQTKLNIAELLCLSL